MHRVYLIHLFNVCGGGEKVSLEAARALNEAGFEVVYITNSAECLRECERLFEVPLSYEVLECRSLVERLLSATGRFVRLRRLLLLSKMLARARGRLDGLIVDTGTNVPSDVDVAYIHYPVVLSTSRSSSPVWRLYDWVVKWRAAAIWGRPRLVLTNSTWTAELVRRVYGVDALVVHPPVDVDFFSYDGRRKEKVVVTVSRFTPEKRLHLLPRVASMLPDYEWYLIGSSGRGVERKGSEAVLEEVEREVRRIGVENFHVVVNAPRSKLRELLLSARFYVHPEFPEHFGIAVAEAMAAGCIPLVYRDGGAWTDLVKPVDPRLGYQSVEEVPSMIRRLEAEERELSWRFAERAKSFSSEAFRERFLSAVRRVAA